MPAVDKRAQLVCHFLVSVEQEVYEPAQLEHVAVHFAPHVIHRKLLISVVAVFLRRVEQIVDVIEKQVERALLIVERDIVGLDAELLHYLCKLLLHLAEKPCVFAKAAPRLAGHDHVRSVARQRPVPQRHARNDVHFGYDVEYVVGKEIGTVEHRHGRCEAVGKNIVLADAAFKGQARAEKIRHGAAAAVSADPELHSAEVKSAA